MRIPTILLLLPLIGCGNTVVDPNPNKDQPDDDTAAEVPDIDFSVVTVEFGDKHFGDRENAAITVYNRGSGTLSVSQITVGTPFTVNPTTFDIGPAGSTTVTVTMAAAAYGDFPDSITFTSSDPDEPEAIVPVHVFVISDEDGDGHDVIAAGGDDCDDADPNSYPGAVEEWYDGVDEDCLGDDDYDQDRDGFQTAAYNPDPESGGGDCQDINVDYYPGAPDEPYDNRDTDCLGNDDYDQDGDGYRSSDYGSGTDCDDYDPLVNGEGIETFNGKDDDCNGVDDDDAQAGAAPIIYDAGSTRDRAGFTLAAGDLDGDGEADAVIAGPYVDATTNNSAGRGGVGVMFGGSGLHSSGTDIDNADSYFEGLGTTDLFGYGLAVMGDYDGDGTLDLAVGAPGVSSNAGAVYLFDGSRIDGVSDPSDAMLSITGASSNSYGRGVGGDIDLDADGAHELVVAYASSSTNALSISYGGSLSGSAYSSDTVLLTTNGVETAFYRNPPYGGDFDGDGYDDLFVSDGTADHGGLTDNGALWAVFGGAPRLAGGAAADIETVATVLTSGTEASAGAAWAVRLVPDWDGDGDDELWVYDQGQGLFVVEGGSGRRAPFDVAVDAVVSYPWHSNSSDVELMARAGDWTGDGLDDVLVFQEDQSGSYGDVDLFSSEIQAGVYNQRDGRIAHIVGSSGYDNGNAGYGIAPVNHDLDGDGDADVLMGDPTFDQVKGQAYVFQNSMNE